MSAPPFYRHGEYSRPEIRKVLDKMRREGRSTVPKAPTENAPGVVKTYHRDEKVSETPTANGMITRVYRDAIGYSPAGVAIGAEGAMMAVVLVFVAMFLGAASYIWNTGSEDRDSMEYLILVMLLATSIYLLIFAIRTEFFGLEDEPLIFDRKHRKVYSIFRESRPGLAGMFQPWPLVATEYDWDLIDVEHHARLATTGSTVYRNHSLLFWVKRSASDATTVDGFSLGSSLIMGSDEGVNAMWEHIRRFMEEGGSHLPGLEKVSVPEPGRPLWKRLLDITPFSRAYWRLWRNFPFMLFLHALAPLTLPMLLTMKIFGWLAIQSKQKLEWPQEILDAVGEPLPLPSARTGEGVALAS